MTAVAVRVGFCQHAKLWVVVAVCGFSEVVSLKGDGYRLKDRDHSPLRSEAPIIVRLHPAGTV